LDSSLRGAFSGLEGFAENHPWTRHEVAMDREDGGRRSENPFFDFAGESFLERRPTREMFSYWSAGPELFIIPPRKPRTTEIDEPSIHRALRAH
jgi:hypothetical protein